MAVNQYKTGAILSYIGIVLTNAVGLFLTPFIIRSLGNSEYGLYSLIGSFVAYLSLMDMGLNNTIVRFVSKYRAEKDYVKEQKFLGTTMIIYCIISFLVIVIGSVMYFNLDSIFSKSLDAGQISQAKVMFLILMFNVAIVLPGGAFTAICTAYERFVFPRSINIVKYIVRAVTIVAVLNWGGKAISLVIIDTILNIALITVSASYVIGKLKARFNFTERHWGAMRPIFGYSIWIFVIAITHSFQWHAGQLVLGINTNTVQVAIFAVGIMLGSYYGSFAGVFNSMLLPKASQMISSDKNGSELTQMMIKVGRISNLISFFILGGFILLGREFIHLWVGQAYDSSWIVALLVMVATTIPLSQSFGMSILEARNKVKFRSIFSLVSLSIGVVVGFFMSKTYGLIGMSASLCGAMIINSIAINIYFIKVFGFKIGSFYKECYFKQIVILSVVIFALNILKTYFEINSWFTLAICIIVFSLIYIVISYQFLMNSYERQQIFKRNI